MQSFLITLLLRSLVMVLLGLFYTAVIPLLLRRYRAKWCYYAWLIIIVGLILPFRLQISSQMVEMPLPVQNVTGAAMEGFPGDITYTRNWMESSAHVLSGFSAWEILMALWILGIVVFFTYHVISHYRFLTMVRRWSHEITDPHTLSVFHDAKEQASIRTEIGIRECHCIYTPMLTGLIRPSILLPSNVYAPEELLSILKHELIHLKRRDLWYRALVIVAVGIHWFNPLVQLIVKEIAALCELSCDAEVVRGADIDLRKQYGKAILRSGKSIRAKSVFSTGFVGGRRNIERRIVAIMDMTKKKTGFIMICLLLIFALGAFGASSAFSVSEVSVSYIDNTFMKERILSGASSGNFSTDGYIIYPEDMDMDTVPLEPAEKRDIYSDTAPAGAYFNELRYRYPFEMVQKDETGRKYTTRVFFDYDYVLSGSIDYEELNFLIGSYLTTFAAVFESSTFEELIQEECIYSMLRDCKKYVDDNADSRVHFQFYLSGIGGDAPINVPHEKLAELNTFN